MTIPFIVKEETGSTNDDLWGLYRRGRREPLALLATRQLRGKGRLGRPWHSEIPGNLCLSLLVFLASEHRRLLPHLPLLTALEVAAVLRSYLPAAVGLKWPNDLMAGERKLGGILVETRGGAGDKVLPVVIGVGLNVNSSPGDFPEDLRPVVACAGELAGRHLPLFDMAREIAYNLERRLAAAAP